MKKPTTSLTLNVRRKRIDIRTHVNTGATVKTQQGNTCLLCQPPPPPTGA